LDYFTSSQLTSDQSDSLLQQIQEIDYLAPAAAAATQHAPAAVRHAPRGRGHSHPLPIFQKVVLSKEQLLQRLQEAASTGLRDEAGEEEEDEEDRQLRMLRQLVEQTMRDS
jgi:hypothetical protein